MQNTDVLYESPSGLFINFVRFLTGLQSIEGLL